MKLFKLNNRLRYPLILLKELVITDFKLRYQGSILGYLWSLLRPLGLFSILYVIFTRVLGVGAGIDNYAIYLLLGVVLWNFFVEITNGTVGSIVVKSEIIRRINFPRVVIPIAGSFSALINLSFNLVVAFVFGIISGVSISSLIFLMPLIIFQLLLLALGVSFFLSALYVKYRDISYVWELVMQAAFYATPVLYPLSMVSDKSLNLAKLLMLNPLAQIIQDARYVAVSNKSSTIASIFGNGAFRVITIVATILIFLLGLLYFNKNSRYFAEEV